jgi:hypothetical protein
MINIWKTTGRTLQLGTTIAFDRDDDSEKHNLHGHWIPRFFLLTNARLAFNIDSAEKPPFILREPQDERRSG